MTPDLTSDMNPGMNPTERTTLTALREEQRLYGDGPCVVFRWDVDDRWRVLEVTSNVLNVLGMEPEALKGAPGIFLNLLDRQDREALVRLAGGAAADFAGRRVVRMRNDQGRQFDMELTLRLEPDAEPPTGRRVARGFLIDATERMAAEAALRQRDHQLKAVVDSAMDAIIAVDADMRVVLFNPAASRIFGYDAQAAVGMHLSQFVPPPVREAHGAHFAAFKQEGVSARRMGVFQRVLGVDARGRTFPVEVTISRATGARAPLFTAIVRDISERLAVEEAQQAQALAERASQAKTAFLSRVSHELRTPLNSILGFAGLLAAATGPRTPTHDEMIAMIRRSGEHLLSLIDDLLDLSRIEQNALRLDVRPVDLGDIVAEAAMMLSPLALAGEITLKVSEGVHGHWVWGDRRACGQIVMNLLSNAVKYNRRGGSVTVEAKRTDDQVHLAVHDTGPGLSDEDIDKLFQPFNRLRADGSGLPGTGLGLVISRSLAAQMQGRIDVESEVGRSSSFVLTLRSAPSSAEPQPNAAVPVAPRPTLSRPGRVIYIEDDEVSALLMRHLVDALPGWTLDVYSSPEQGIRAALAERPDIVLTDMNLPGMSGAEVIRSLRADPTTRDIQIVVVSADAMIEQIRTVLNAGANAYWTKPIDVERVTRSLQELVYGQTVNAPWTTGRATP